MNKLEKFIEEYELKDYVWLALHDQGRMEYDEFLKEYPKTPHVFQIAFVWSDTRQGVDFWGLVNKLYRKYYEKNK